MTMLLRALAIAAAVAAFVDMATAANYVVGAPTGGWDLNTQLQSWANNKTFFVGDTLTFMYGPSHSVLQVSKSDYDACLTNASIASYSGGNTAITLSSSGSSYYICGTPGHCDGGMKVVISVLPAPAPPTTTPSVPPPAATPSVPPPAATPSVPPPAATPSSPTPATPSGSPTSSPTVSPVASPPKPAAPTSSPKLSPSVSPSKSPASSPSKSPAISPASSPPASAAESPASPPSTDASSPSGSNPPSSANKVNVVTGFTTAVGFTIMMLLTL